MNGNDCVELEEKYHDKILQSYILALEDGLEDIPDRFTEEWIMNRGVNKEDEQIERLVEEKVYGPEEDEGEKHD